MLQKRGKIIKVGNSKNNIKNPKLSFVRTIDKKKKIRRGLSKNSTAFLLSQIGPHSNENFFLTKFKHVPAQGIQRPKFERNLCNRFRDNLDGRFEGRTIDEFGQLTQSLKAKRWIFLVG